MSGCNLGGPAPERSTSMPHLEGSESDASSHQGLNPLAPAYPTSPDQSANSVDKKSRRTGGTSKKRGRGRGGRNRQIPVWGAHSSQPPFFMPRGLGGGVSNPPRGWGPPGPPYQNPMHYNAPLINVNQWHSSSYDPSQDTRNVFENESSTLPPLEDPVGQSEPNFKGFGEIPFSATNKLRRHGLVLPIGDPSYMKNCGEECEDFWGNPPCFLGSSCRYAHPMNRLTPVQQDFYMMRAMEAVLGMVSSLVIRNSLNDTTEIEGREGSGDDEDTHLSRIRKQEIGENSVEPRSIPGIADHPTKVGGGPPKDSSSEPEYWTLNNPKTRSLSRAPTKTKLGLYERERASSCTYLSIGDPFGEKKEKRTSETSQGPPGDSREFFLGNEVLDHYYRRVIRAVDGASRDQLRGSQRRRIYDLVRELKGQPSRLLEKLRETIYAENDKEMLIVAINKIKD